MNRKYQLNLKYTGSVLQLFDFLKIVCEADRVEAVDNPGQADDPGSR